MHQLYGIFWKHIDGSRHGNGDFCFSLIEARNLCMLMNMKYENKIHHWYMSKTDYETCNPSNDNPSNNESSTDPCTLEA